MRGSALLLRRGTAPVICSSAVLCPAHVWMEWRQLLPVRQGQSLCTAIPFGYQSIMFMYLNNAEYEDIRW